VLCDRARALCARVTVRGRHNGKTIELFIVRQAPGIQECLQRCFPKTILARVWASLIVLLEPRIEIVLQLLQGRVELFAKSHAIELILHGAMEAFADAVGAL
jgi:hypothetical protein